MWIRQQALVKRNELTMSDATEHSGFEPMSATTITDQTYTLFSFKYVVKNTALLNTLSIYTINSQSLLVSTDLQP